MTKQKIKKLRSTAVVVGVVIVSLNTFLQQHIILGTDVGRIPGIHQFSHHVIFACANWVYFYTNINHVNYPAGWAYMLVCASYTCGHIYIYVWRATLYVMYIHKYTHTHTTLYGFISCVC